MHSSKEKQIKSDPNDSLFGMALGQFFMASVLGPVADMVWEAAEAASVAYTDRFQANAKRTNGDTDVSKFVVGVKNSLGNCFSRSQTLLPALPSPRVPSRPYAPAGW